MGVLARTAGLAALFALGCAEAPAGRLPPTPCPERMARIPSADACIDRFEAVLVEGVARSAEGRRPTSGVSFFTAERACRAAGLRLCSRDEWTLACAGSTDPEEQRPFAYDGDYEFHRCNHSEFGADPATLRLAHAGGFTRCVTPEGVYDLSGNVGEWIDGADPTGDLRELRGGSFASPDRYAHCVTDPLIFQPPESEFDGQGFRCCRDVRR